MMKVNSSAVAARPDAVALLGGALHVGLAGCLAVSVQGLHFPDLSGRHVDSACEVGHTACSSPHQGQAVNGLRLLYVALCHGRSAMSCLLSCSLCVDADTGCLRCFKDVHRAPLLSR